MSFILNNGVGDTNPLPVADHGSENIATGIVQLSATPTLIVDARPGRKAVLLNRFPGADNAIYVVAIGDQNISDSNCYVPFNAGMTQTRVDTAAAIYGFTPGGQAQLVTYLELF